ncbi:MAG: OmpA family protein [Haliea sp.]|nr:OmpA family protein [Haliea sp.]
MRALLFLLVLLVGFQPAQGKEPLSDHPLVRPYQDSTLRRKDVNDFDAYQLITGTDMKEFSGLTLEGKVTKLLYGNPKDRSLLEMSRNYEQALKRGGAEILFQCNQEKYDCVKGLRRSGLSEAQRYSWHEQYQGPLHEREDRAGDLTAYIAIAVGQSFTDVHVIEIKKMDTGMASIDAAALGEGIDKDGYVIVEGIYFDTDKTTLKPESKPALEMVSKLLASRANMKLYVVGHTDTQGSLSHNMALSLGRAKAVAAALSP